MSKPYPVEIDRLQTSDILLASGMSAEQAATTTDSLIDTDPRGVDTLAVTPLLGRNKPRALRQANMRPVFTTKWAMPKVALIDPDTSNAHPAVR